jgi:hypothetical protein
MAIILVLISLTFLAILLGALATYSSGDLFSLQRLVAGKNLLYLVRMGLSTAEARLLTKRWYAPASEGMFELTSPDGQGTIRVYVDDFVRIKPKTVNGTDYKLLDHIKVSVIATWRGDRMYGFGKFVISPEPIYDARGSTIGANPQNSIGADGNVKYTTTLRKLINIHILLPDEVAHIPGFVAIDQFASRKAMAQSVIPQQLRYAENYGRNLRLSQAIRRGFPSPASTTFTVAQVKDLLRRKDPAGVPTTNAAATPDAVNRLKNAFLMEVFSRFFMTTDWDISPEEKARKLEKIHVVIGTVPVKTTDPETRQAIGLAFPGHPIDVREGIDYWTTFTPENGRTAGAKYLAQRGYSPTAVPTEKPSLMAADLSEIQTANSYLIGWKGKMRFVYIGEEDPPPRPRPARWSITVRAGLSRS